MASTCTSNSDEDYLSAYDYEDIENLCQQEKAGGRCVDSSRKSSESSSGQDSSTSASCNFPPFARAAVGTYHTARQLGRKMAGRMCEFQGFSGDSSRLGK